MAGFLFWKEKKKKKKPPLGISECSRDFRFKTNFLILNIISREMDVCWGFMSSQDSVSVILFCSVLCAFRRG